MTRLLAAMVVISLMVGCRAPAPNMGMITPYGAATVPAPSTGAVGTSGDYYAPPTPPPPGDSSTGGLQAPGAFIGDGVSSTTNVDPAVQPASYTPGTTSGAALPGASSSSNLRLDGMRVNDGTSAAQPPPPGQPVNLTQLPDAGQSPSVLRILSPNSTPTYTPLPAASSPPVATPASNTNWQQR